MEYLTLEMIKDELRIDNNCYDAQLERYGTGAEEAIAGILNRGDTVSECVQSLINQYGAIPEVIYECALQIVEVSYDYRSPVSRYQLYAIGYGFDFKLKRFIIL